MTIQGLGQGWQAGVRDVGLGLGQAVRGGNARAVAEVAGNTMERAGAAVTGFFRQAGAAVANMAGDALATVGANDMAQEAHQAGHDLRATGFEGQAQSSLQKAGSHFKRAFTAAFRSYKDTNIKGLGANLTFSVASWGANMWEGIKNFGCAIGNGCKSLVERIRS